MTQLQATMQSVLETVTASDAVGDFQNAGYGTGKVRLLQRVQILL